MDRDGKQSRTEMIALIRTIAIADALGAPYEFADQEKRSKYDGSMNLGIYTDDTQMTLAIAEHMLFDCRMSQESYAESFIESYRRDPRGGYSKRTRTALESPSPQKMLAKGIFGPRGNGSVMRCLPLGLYSEPAEVIGRAMVQSTTTHLSLAATNASVLTALTAHYIYHKWEDLNGLLSFLNEQVGTGLVRDIIKDGKVDGEIGNDTIQTASWCIRTAANMIASNNLDAAHACRLAVEIGGDVDSLCAVTAGLISLRAGYKYNFASYEPTMEQTPFSIEYMKSLDISLFNQFPRN
jgi:ADP-ribosylglycohydrolase